MHELTVCFHIDHCGATAPLPCAAQPGIGSKEMVRRMRARKAAK